MRWTLISFWKSEIRFYSRLHFVVKKSVVCICFWHVYQMRTTEVHAELFKKTMTCFVYELMQFSWTDTHNLIKLKRSSVAIKIHNIKLLSETYSWKLSQILTNEWPLVESWDIMWSLFFDVSKHPQTLIRYTFYSHCRSLNLGSADLFVKANVGRCYSITKFNYWYCRL